MLPDTCHLFFLNQNLSYRNDENNFPMELCKSRRIMRIAIPADSGSQIQLSRDKLNNEEGSPQGRNRSLTFLGRVLICIHSLRAFTDPLGEQQKLVSPGPWAPPPPQRRARTACECRPETARTRVGPLADRGRTKQWSQP